MQSAVDAHGSVRFIRKVLIVIHLAFALGPMASAACANEDEADLVLGWLCECDSFAMTAPFAFHITSSAQSRVLDALGVDLDVLSSLSVISPVDAVVNLIILLGSHVAMALLAFKVEIALVLVHAVLTCLKHVVALGAEADSLELLLSILLCSGL